MLVDCPVCDCRHRLNDRYDNMDFICLNGASRDNQKIFQNMVPEDLLTRSNPVMNRTSTKVDEARPVTVITNGKPSFRNTGERVGEVIKNW